jgi:hypothetical protein
VLEQASRFDDFHFWGKFMNRYGTYELCLLFILLAFLFCVTAGWGQLATRLLGLPAARFWQPSSLWLGLICWIMALGLANFFIPINWLMRCGVTFVGVLGLISIKDLRKQITLMRQALRKRPVTAVLFAIGLIMLCLKSLQAPNNFDSALYHFQTMRWLNEYAIVPGLGNLHGRLAFNQSYFNFLAFVNIQPIASKGYASAGLFILGLCAASLVALYRSLDVGRIWIPLVLGLGIGLNLDLLRSPTPDFAIVLLQIQLFICLIVLVKPTQVVNDERLTHIVLCFVVASFIFTVKISALSFAFAAIVVVLPLVRQFPISSRPVLIRTGALCIGFLCAHVARGYVLSGAPLFPSSIGALWNLPWAMLPENVQGEADWIYSWARTPGANPSVVLGNWDWFGPWLARLPKSFVFTLGSGLVMLGLNVLMLNRMQRADRLFAPYALYIPLILAIIFWFFTAPDYRFLGAIPTLFVTLGGWLNLLQINNLLPASQKILLPLSRNSKAFVQLFAAAIFLHFIGVRSLTLSVPTQLPRVIDSVQKTNTGQIFYQPQDTLCWDSVLPCSPFVHPALKLLVPELGVAAGFTLK